MDKEVLDMTFKFIVAIAVIVGPIIQIWLQSNKNAVLDEKIDYAAKVAKDTHTLVNSNMGVQLELNAIMARRLASKLDASPEDAAAADLADRNLAAHRSKQKVVDAG